MLSDFPRIVYSEWLSYVFLSTHGRGDSQQCRGGICEAVLVGEVAENKVIRIKETAVKYVNVIISVDDVWNDLRP